MEDLSKMKYHHYQRAITTTSIELVTHHMLSLSINFHDIYILHVLVLAWNINIVHIIKTNTP